MYRDSQYGLTLDLTGPDGNVFNLFAIAEMLDKQLDREHEFRRHIDLVNQYCESIGKGRYNRYEMVVMLFEKYYPFIHLIKAEEE